MPARQLGAGRAATLKLEMLEPVGSFKERGTETATAAAQRRTVSRLVCASAGNLGQALAYSVPGEAWR